MRLIRRRLMPLLAVLPAAAALSGAAPLASAQDATVDLPVAGMDAHVSLGSTPMAPDVGQVLVGGDDGGKTGVYQQPSGCIDVSLGYIAKVLINDTNVPVTAYYGSGCSAPINATANPGTGTTVPFSVFVGSTVDTGFVGSFMPTPGLADNVSLGSALSLGVAVTGITPAKSAVTAFVANNEPLVGYDDLSRCNNVTPTRALFNNSAATISEYISPDCQGTVVGTLSAGQSGNAVNAQSFAVVADASASAATPATRAATRKAACLRSSHAKRASRARRASVACRKPRR